MPSYLVPAQSTSTEYIVKKSRFITQLHAVKDRVQAMALLEQAKTDYPDARHHCWAYQLGSPASPYSAAMSDDGEPSGTAGKPILNVIQHKEVGNIMIIVIRYFGGIKLGAGGLVRAYSSATQQAFEKASFKEQRAVIKLKVDCDFADEQRLRHEITQLKGSICDALYTDKVTLEIEIEEEPAKTLRSLVEGFSGAAVRAN